MAQKMELLKDKSKRVVTDVREGIVVQLFNGHSIQPVSPTSGPVETAKNIHRRAFSGSTGSHHREVIPLTDGEIQLIKCFDLEITGSIDLADFIEFSDCRF